MNFKFQISNFKSIILLLLCVLCGSLLSGCGTAIETAYPIALATANQLCETESDDPEACKACLDCADHYLTEAWIKMKAKNQAEQDPK